MRLSPDEIIFWQYGFIKLNATIAVTWGLMLLLTAGSTVITRNLDPTSPNQVHMVFDWSALTVGAMFVLESDLDFSAAINSLVGSDGSK